MENSTKSGVTKWFTALVIAMVVGMVIQILSLGYLAFKPGSGTPPSVIEAAATTPGGWQLMNPPAPAKPSGPAQVQTDPITPFNPGQWDPFQELLDMEGRVDAIFNNAFGRMGASPRFSPLRVGIPASPTMDIIENDHEYQVRVDLPGSDESKIDVSLEGQQLKVCADRTGEVSGKTPGTMLRTERHLGRYERSMTLPKPVLAGSLQSHYDNGVLTITVQKEK